MMMIIIKITTTIMIIRTMLMDGETFLWKVTGGVIQSNLGRVQEDAIDFPMMIAERMNWALQ